MTVTYISGTDKFLVSTLNNNTCLKQCVVKRQCYNNTANVDNNCTSQHKAYLSKSIGGFSSQGIAKFRCTPPLTRTHQPLQKKKLKKLTVFEGGSLVVLVT